ncbi:MAG: hypothetical protein AAB300_02075 [Nitrospirota bacterium]
MPIRSFSNRFRLLASGTLFIFLLTACGEPYFVPVPSVQQQPPPPGPGSGDQDGGSNLTALIGGVVGVVVIGFLIKRWLSSQKEKEKKETVPGEVLVVIPLAPLEQMTALGEELSVSHAIQLPTGTCEIAAPASRRRNNKTLPVQQSWIKQGIPLPLRFAKTEG